MTKLLVVLVVLGGAAYLMYAFVWNAAPARACAKLAVLCGEKTDPKGCDDYFMEVKKVSPEEADRVAKCINDSTSCGQAVGCEAGGVAKIGVHAAKDFFGGLRRAFSEKK